MAAPHSGSWVTRSRTQSRTLLIKQAAPACTFHSPSGGCSTTVTDFKNQSPKLAGSYKFRPGLVWAPNVHPILVPFDGDSLLYHALLRLLAEGVEPNPGPQDRRLQSDLRRAQREVARLKKIAERKRLNRQAAVDEKMQWKTKDQLVEEGVEPNPGPKVHVQRPGSAPVPRKKLAVVRPISTSAPVPSTVTPKKKVPQNKAARCRDMLDTGNHSPKCANPKCPVLLARNCLTGPAHSVPCSNRWYFDGHSRIPICQLLASQVYADVEDFVVGSPSNIRVGPAPPPIVQAKEKENETAAAVPRPVLPEPSAPAGTEDGPHAVNAPGLVGAELPHDLPSTSVPVPPPLRDLSGPHVFITIDDSPKPAWSKSKAGWSIDPKQLLDQITATIPLLNAVRSHDSAIPRSSQVSPAGFQPKPSGRWWWPFSRRASVEKSPKRQPLIVSGIAKGTPFIQRDPSFLEWLHGLLPRIAVDEEITETRRVLVTPVSDVRPAMFQTAQLRRNDCGPMPAGHVAKDLSPSANVCVNTGIVATLPTQPVAVESANRIVQRKIGDVVAGIACATPAIAAFALTYAGLPVAVPAALSLAGACAFFGNMLAPAAWTRRTISYIPHWTALLQSVYANEEQIKMNGLACLNRQPSLNIEAAHWPLLARNSVEVAAHDLRNFRVAPPVWRGF